MIKAPDGMGLFEFCVVTFQRTPQLMRGAPQRLAGKHKAIVMAQMEVAAGEVKPVSALPGSAAASPESGDSMGVRPL